MEPTRSERAVVYSAVVGRVESLPAVENPDPHLTYLLFTDGVITTAPPPWQLRTIPPVFRDPARDSRRLKLLPHLFLPDFDISVWVDAKADILDLSREKVIEFLGDASMAFLRHPVRSCLYAEAKVVMRKGLDSPGRVARQITAYRAAGMPEGMGLFVGTFFIRRHNEASCKLFDNLWWEQLVLHSRRDQISLPYVRWLLGMPIEILPLDLRRNQVFSGNAKRDLKSGIKRTRSVPEGLGSALRVRAEQPPNTIAYQPLFDVWPPEFVTHLMALNRVIADGRSELFGSAAYLDGEGHFRYAPPDPRLGPDREVLLRAIADRHHLVQVGFGAGHAALLALTHSKAQVTAVESQKDARNEAGARYLEEAFPSRFRVAWLEDFDTGDLEIGDCDAVHVSRAVPPAMRDAVIDAIRARARDDTVLVVEQSGTISGDVSSWPSLDGVRLDSLADIQAGRSVAFKVARPSPPRAQPSVRVAGMGYRDVLQHIHKIVKPRVYLEIGVAKSGTLRFSEARTIGIDPTPRIDEEFLSSRPLLSLYRMPSDEFFTAHTRELVLGADHVDFAFIDGLHEFGQVLRDFINVERWCHPSGIIAVHDVIPRSLQVASRRRISGAWCGDVWKLVDCLRTYRPDLDCALVDTGPSGLLLVRNLDPANERLSAVIDDILRSAPNDDRYDEAVQEYLQRVAALPREDGLGHIGTPAA